MKKLLALLSLLVASSFAGSMLGLDALGKEDFAGATGAVAGHGFAGGAKTGDGVVMGNPSNLAFEDKVSFSVTLDYELTEAEKSDYAYKNSSLNIPSFYLSFPLGDFGALALGISQHYSSNLDVKSSDSSRSQDVHLEYAGSVFEIVPIYAVRVPFFRHLSLGAAMHIVSGSNERSLTLGPDNSGIADEDAWATNKSKVTDVVKGEWSSEEAGYYTFSAMYRGRLANEYLLGLDNHCCMQTYCETVRREDRDDVEEAVDLLAEDCNMAEVASHTVHAEVCHHDTLWCTCRATSLYDCCDGSFLVLCLSCLGDVAILLEPCVEVHDLVVEVYLWCLSLEFVECLLEDRQRA